MSKLQDLPPSSSTRETNTAGVHLPHDCVSSFAIVDISLDFSFLYSVYFFVQNCMVYSCFLFVFLSVFAHMISLSFSTCLSFLPSFFFWYLLGYLFFLSLCITISCIRFFPGNTTISM